jgi:hypothetical protein
MIMMERMDAMRMGTIGVLVDMPESMGLGRDSRSGQRGLSLNHNINTMEKQSQEKSRKSAPVSGLVHLPIMYQSKKAIQVSSITLI